MNSTNPTLALFIEAWPLTIAVLTILLLIAVLVRVTWWWDRRDERCVTEASDLGHHDEATEVSDAGRQLRHSPAREDLFSPAREDLFAAAAPGTLAQPERRHSMPSVSGDYYNGTTSGTGEPRGAGRTAVGNPVVAAAYVDQHWP
jgi:hypothetical protein